MNKDHYFRIEDFIEDQSFVNWVKRSNSQDVAFWQQWLLDNPGKLELAYDAAMMIDGILFEPRTTPDIKVEAALSRLNERIDQQSDRSLVRKNRTINKRKPLMIAAGIAVIITCFFTVQWFFQPREILYRTAYGEQIDLKLADGTEVALNANSTLHYYSNNSREVWLEGEAFFKVEKKPSTGARFLVHTPDLDVEVLGTSFNVNRRLEKTEVLLKEGSVKLNLKNGEQKMMTPGDLIVFSAKVNKVLELRKKVRAELHTSWKDGTLYFEDISLRQAMEKIRETYGVEVIFENEAQASRVIRFGVPTKNLDMCIKAFEMALEIDIEKTTNNSQLIIRGD